MTPLSATTGNKIVDVRCGWLFPMPFLLLAGVVTVAGFFMLFQDVLISLALLVPGALVLSAHEGTEIDSTRSTYREYNAFLGIKTGQRLNYNQIQSVFINSGKVTRRMYSAHTTQSSDFTTLEYKVWLQLDGKKVLLFTGRSKKRVLAKADQLASWLKTDIIDHTASR